MKWRGHESVRRGSRDSKATPEFMASGHSNVLITTPAAFKKQSGTNSVIHPIVKATWNNKNESSRSNVGASRSNNVSVTMGDYLSSSSQKENIVSREPTKVTFS